MHFQTDLELQTNLMSIVRQKFQRTSRSKVMWKGTSTPFFDHKPLFCLLKSQMKQEFRRRLKQLKRYQSIVPGKRLAKSKPKQAQQIVSSASESCRLVCKILYEGIITPSDMRQLAPRKLINVTCSLKIVGLDQDQVQKTTKVALLGCSKEPLYMVVINNEQIQQRQESVLVSEFEQLVLFQTILKYFYLVKYLDYFLWNYSASETFTVTPYVFRVTKMFYSNISFKSLKVCLCETMNIMFK